MFSFFKFSLFRTTKHLFCGGPVQSPLFNSPHQYILIYLFRYQMSRFRNCQSPELTRLSAQIHDLKRKIAHIQLNQNQNDHGTLQKNLFNPKKVNAKCTERQKSHRQSKTQKIVEIKQSQEHRVSKAQTQVLYKLQKFQEQFLQKANKISQFIKKLAAEIYKLEDTLLSKLKEMKDQIAENINKDVTKFMQKVEKYQITGSLEEVNSIEKLRQKIQCKLQYNTLEIDTGLIRLQANIKKTIKQIEKPPSPKLVPKQQDISQQVIYHIHINRQDSIGDKSQTKSNKQSSRSEAQTKAALSPKSQSNRNHLCVLQDSRKQTSSAKQLLKI